MVVKDTLRARQAEATRQLLVATARDLFTEQGFAATSIEEIVQRAGVAKGALYHHFSGKNDLFRAVYDAVQADAVAGVVAAALAERGTVGRSPGGAVGLPRRLPPAGVPPGRRARQRQRAAAGRVGRRHRTQRVPDAAHRADPAGRRRAAPRASASSRSSTSRSAASTARRCSSPESPQPRVARRDVEAVLDALIAGLRSRLAPDEPAPEAPT